MEFTIKLKDLPNNMVAVDFHPTVERILAELKSSGKCSPAEEMVLLAAELWQKKSEKNKVKSRSGLILPN